MEHILKYFALTTIVLAGATGKFLNGPWIINKIDEYSHPQVRVPGQALSPVIFVPGDGGSRIEARLNKPSTVHYFCDKTTKDWFNLWLNLELLAPLIIDCWTDNVKLHYDINTRTTSNSPGVETRVPGWGSPEVVEWIDPSQAKQGAYFKEIGNALVRGGYVRNVSMRGAPYDFRKGPNELGQYFINLKDLVEETYKMNDNEPITFIAHSMGAPMLTIFFHQMNEEWKEKYISRMITIAGAYGGSAKTVKVFAVGDDLGAYAPGARMREEQISMPSLSFLLPYPDFWKPEEVLVRTRKRNYTYSQLSEFFDDLGYPNGWEMRKDQQKFVEDFTAPKVEVHCLYGSQINTVEGLNYTKSDDLSGSPELIFGDGDGTVNSRSLKGCIKWRGHQRQPVTTLEIPKGEHFEILGNPQIVSYIRDVLLD